MLQSKWNRQFQRGLSIKIIWRCHVFFFCFHILSSLSLFTEPNKKGNSRYFRLRSHLLFPLYMQLVHKIFSRCVYYNNFFVSVNFFLQVFSLYLILYIYLSVLNNTHDRSVSPQNIYFPAGHVPVLSDGS